MDFNWNGEDEKEDVIVPRVDAIAVYSNAIGDIVIRQQDGMGGDDSLIIFPRIHAQLLIDAIQRQINDKG